MTPMRFHSPTRWSPLLKDSFKIKEKVQSYFSSLGSRIYYWKHQEKLLLYLPCKSMSGGNSKIVSSAHSSPKTPLAYPPTERSNRVRNFFTVSIIIIAPKTSPSCLYYNQIHTRQHTTQRPYETS